MFSEPQEPFVDAYKVANFLSLTRRRILELVRAGRLPAYPLGNGQRRVWRFRLSEIASAMSKQAARPSVEFNPAVTQSRSTKG